MVLSLRKALPFAALIAMALESALAQRVPCSVVIIYLFDKPLHSQPLGSLRWLGRDQRARALVMGHRSDVRAPERRLSVADQFGSDRFHDLGGIVEPVVTVGSSMLIALQAGVG